MQAIGLVKVADARRIAVVTTTGLSRCRPGPA